MSATTKPESEAQGFHDSVDDMDRYRRQPSYLQSILIRMGVVEEDKWDGSPVFDEYELCTPLWPCDPALLGAHFIPATDTPEEWPNED